MYRFLNFLRNVIWTSVSAVALVAASIVTAVAFDAPMASVSFAISAVALAIISKQE